MSILNLIAASYAAQEEEPSLPREPKAPKIPREPKAPKGAKQSARPIACEVLPDHMIEKGTYNGEQFLLAIRDAGKRRIEGRIIFDASFVREDTIRAIGGYLGFNPSRPFGAQELECRQAAQRERVAIKGERYKRTLTAPTVKGYVAGSYDNCAKRKSNLEAREVLVAAAIAAYSTVSDKASFAKAIERHYHGANPHALLAAGSDDATARKIAVELLSLESARLQEIRQELTSF
jgi:hypothetical protein